MFAAAADGVVVLGPAVEEFVSAPVVVVGRSKEGTGIRGRDDAREKSGAEGVVMTYG